MKIRSLILLSFVSLFTRVSFAQDVNKLIGQVKSKLEKVNDYTASATMKTDVSFLKLPEALVKIYYKKPDKIKIVNDKGISLVPKGVLMVNLNNLIVGNYTAIEAGTENSNGTRIRIVKLIPLEEKSNVVLSTIYIDEGKLLIVRAITTTRDNGSYEVNLKYGKFTTDALPDQVIFSFNTRDYKLPKGITFDYDDGSKKNDTAPAKDQKGKVEITYRDYEINKGIPDNIFK